MKICIEAQRIFRPKKHGMDIVALEMIRSLQQIDTVNEYYILVKPDTDNQVLRETANFHIVEIPGGPYPYWEQVKLPQAVKKIRPDLLHCTSNTAPLNLGVPLVLTLHDIIYLEQLHFSKGTWYQRMGNLYRRWNVPRILPHCSAILTVSDFEKHRITEFLHLPANAVETVYNAKGDHFRVIGDTAAKEAFRTKYGLPEAFIFFLGNTDPKKNVPNVLKAMARLYREKATTLPLVMPDLEKSYLASLLKEINEPLLEEKIFLTGYIPNQELPFVYNLATLFLYPSLRESFGIPIIEAMACGVPVITSSTSSMPEIAGDAALLVDPHNPAEIAAATMQVLTTNELRNSLIEKGLERSKYFTWENTSRKVLAVYSHISNNQ